MTQKQITELALAEGYMKAFGMLYNASAPKGKKWISFDGSGRPAYSEKKPATGFQKKGNGGNGKGLSLDEAMEQATNGNGRKLGPKAKENEAEDSRRLYINVKEKPLSYKGEYTDLPLLHGARPIERRNRHKKVKKLVKRLRTFDLNGTPVVVYHNPAKDYTPELYKLHG